jgi:hypothetical protein
MSWSLTQPPNWVPDAIATDRGWVDPATGELIVAIRGLNVKNAGPAVVKVSRIGNITKYGRTTTLSFRVKFNEVVVVTGTPRIPLTIGANSSLFATYASGTGSSSLVFSYAIQNVDSGAISIASPIALNSGTILDASNTPAVLTFTPPNTAGMTVDTTLPTADDSEDITPTAFVTGDNIDVIVNFSEPVAVTGVPRVELDFNGTQKFANYASGSGTSALTFRYTVQEADSVNAGDFDVVNTTGDATIDLNGGTIKDLAGNSTGTPDFTIPTNLASVSVNSTAAPTITGVTFDSGNGPHSLAKTSLLNFTVNFSKAVVVTGSPRMTLSVNGNAKNATYLSGSGSKALVFQYAVVSGDNATASQFSASSPLTLNGGTIKDIYGTNATLSFTAPTTSGVVIDNTAPAAPSVAFVQGAGNYNAGDVFEFTATYVGNIAVVGSPRIPFTINGVQRYALFSSVASNVATFSYTVQASDAATSGQIVLTSPIDLNGGTIKDLAENNAVVTFTPPSMSGVVIDNVAPVINTVTGPSGGPNYKLGDTLTLTATFSEAVTVTGTPRIAMDVNFTTKYATYASGTGTSTLTFTYTVASNDNANLPGQFALISPMQLNGGTIVDAAGNPITNLSFNLPDNSAKRVDGVAPASPVVTISGDTANAFVTGNVLTLTATFNEAVVVTNTPRIAVTIGSNTRQANYASGSGTNALVFQYTIVGGDSATAGNVTTGAVIDLNTTGTVKDVVGNNATLSFLQPNFIVAKTVN